jgi:hypothetical protein
MKPLLVLLVLLCAAPLAAQTPVTPTSAFAWDQNDLTAATASQYTWRWVIDTVVQATPVIPATACVLASPGPGAVCTAAAPATTPGLHDLAVQVSRTVSGSTLRATSLQLSIEMLMVAAPQNLRPAPIP